MKVSIITALRGVIFPRTMKSIVNQTNKNFEWVVVTDGLNTSGFSAYYDEVPSMKTVTLWDNYGPSVARNVGFQISDGDIITYLDSDDELSEGRVAQILDIWEKYSVDLLFSGYYIVEEEKSFLLNHFNYFDNKEKVGGFKDASEYLKLLQKQNISIPMGVAHSRKAFVEAGGFQRGIVCGEDGILWRRMIDNLEPSRIMFSDYVAGKYHVNQSGQSRKQPRFEMGGFAFDGSKNDNGKYLDEEWFKTYSSVNLFDGRS
jgi:glycosyltransferase involved in cell wall biosynthesis